LTGKCPNLTFKVRDTIVVTNDRTRFRGGNCDDIRDRRRVDVKGRRLPDGRVDASEVRRDD
jgi:hypothetical protein